MAPVLREDPFGWVGHVLEGKYRIDSVVGEGGFGVVYRAHHLGFEQSVAVKCLKLKKNLDLDAHDEFLRRFIAEGRLLHQLSRATADVVQCLDVSVAVSPKGIETPYLVLEWLDGTTLDRELRNNRNRPYSLEEGISLLEPAARGLAAAHAQNVSHRDVKPSNIMLTEVGGRMTRKVVDFGIAKAAGDVDTSTGPFDNLGSGMSAFTPRYGAPEQFSRKYGATGPWTDVYALALILVEIVSGKPALDGDDPVQLYVESSDVHKRPTLRNRGVETSDAIDSVLVQALAVDPRARYKDAGEFWDALTGALGERARPRSVRPPAIVKTPMPGAIPVFDRGGETLNPTGTGTITVLLREQKKRQAVWIGAIAATLILVTFGFLGMRAADKEVATAGSATATTTTTPSATTTTTASATTIPTATSEVGAVPANMVMVAPATFTMGSDHDGKGEKPAHQVTLTRAFYIDRTEVTTEAYGNCVKAGNCTATRMQQTSGGHTINAASVSCNAVGDPNFARQPINCVTAEQAVTFCRSLGKRLPTEAEWELAARGTDGRSYPWGNDAPHSCRQAIVGGLDGPCGARKGTWEVATTVDGTSPSGAYDMAGNVWEWIADDFEAYPKERVVDPFLPPRTGKGIVRGGSWDYSGLGAKATMRLQVDRTFALNNVGFRCAK